MVLMRAANKEGLSFGAEHRVTSAKFINANKSVLTFKHFEVPEAEANQLFVAAFREACTG